MQIFFTLDAPELVAALNAQTAEIKRLADLFARTIPPRLPRNFHHLFVRELKELDMWFEIYSLTAAKSTEEDVVNGGKRTLTVSIDGVAGEPKDYPGDTTEFVEAVRAPKGSTVSATLVDTDDDGLSSGVTTLEPFVAQDEHPPVSPGDFAKGLFVREELVADAPAPAPEPATEPAPEAPAEPAPEAPAEPTA